MRGQSVAISFLALISAAVCGGCTSGATGADHGRAASVAAKDARTWVPIAVGIAFDAFDWDRDVSDALAGEGASLDGADYKGLVSSRHTAARISDVLAYGTTFASLGASSLKSGKGFPSASTGEALLAAASTFGVTKGLKEGWHRRRPNGQDNLSFPSGHASIAASSAAMLRYSLRRNPRLGANTRRWLDGALTALPYATGFLRVEAKKHYPSDVLVGTGIGNFFGTYFGEIGEARRGRQRVHPVVSIRRRGSERTVHLGAQIDI